VSGRFPNGLCLIAGNATEQGAIAEKVAEAKKRTFGYKAQASEYEDEVGQDSVTAKGEGSKFCRQLVHAKGMQFPAALCSNVKAYTNNPMTITLA